MKSRSVTGRSLLAAFLLTAALPLAAQQQESGTGRAIPYKTEPSPIESHGEGVGIAMLLLLVGAGGVLYFVRRRLPHMQIKLGMGAEGKRIRIIEQTRLNPRCTLYLVRLNQREILIGQCGDTLTTLDATAAQVEEQGREIGSA